ncbi:hypothetical protein BDW59DRAFT_174313 [Aspergillus cavernicola]|uniref:FAD-binding domain-containing protein n=1 Tax=Aspergillus cavernicola TaxID=176166 RepID=A0ABR4HZR7_9EURO
MENCQFKVIIVGGSIAGLTLAHCLHRANIDHIIIEKREEIAPQEGASIGLWPNGSQVLEQLGLYDEMERQTEPLNRFLVAQPDGSTWSNSMPQALLERFGYPIVFFERQKVLHTLYERYPEKARILVNKQVTEVRQTADGVSVVTDDELTYQGSIVVGADGVHSRVRSEMWRLVDDQEPGIMKTREKSGMTAEFACVFGISNAIPGLHSGEHFNVYGQGVTVMTFHGKDRVYWFVINKMDRKYTYPDIPRYSQKDAAETCGSRFGHVRISGDVCIRHLWEKRMYGSMTAMEEGIFETMFHGRVVLMGDAARKMTVNLGQGANSAMEDAALLSTLLEQTIKTRPADSKCQPTDDQIKRLFKEYQTQRYARTNSLYQRSRFSVRLQTRDDPMKAFLGRFLLPHATTYACYIASKMVADGAVVGFLPVPGRSSSSRVCVKP